MKDIVCEYNSCTGCALCASICPVSCITMKPGKLGHLFPQINKAECIDCGLCRKKCPSLNPIGLNYSQHAFAAWAKDTFDYVSSTSGGVSSVLSRFIIDNGGVVYGCAFLHGPRIEHIRIERKDDISKIKGSKYVQSSILKALQEIKEDIKVGRMVLFIGTPCQTAAVRNLFVNVPDNLFLVDLVCHGTPSQKTLFDYLKRQVPIAAIDDLKFRSENNYVINVFSTNRIVFTSPLKSNENGRNYFLGAFLDGYTIRDSCSRCIYSTPKRGTDITIGDFWGLGKELSCEEIPEHKYGISLVLTNTEKGWSLFNAVSGALNVFERPVSEAVNGNDRLRHPKERTTSAGLYCLLHISLLGD